MEDNIEVAPSEDNGNVPVETPSETPETVVTTEKEPVASTEPTLYELPDGRKVDAETLTKEWKDNFLPEFTRKSQELAAVKAPINKETPEESPYKDPSYVPKTYEELIEEAERRALATIEGREQAAQEARQEVENEVANQLSMLKTKDPTLDENALFLHANKYQFRDLGLAYDNMKEMAKLAKTVQQTTAKNIAKRTDPVSVTPNANGTRTAPSNFSNAVEYLRSLK